MGADWHTNPGSSRMAEQRRLIVSQENDVTVVDFSDATSLDAYHIDEISKDLFALVDDKNIGKIVLDLATIKMLSSQTLGVFLTMRKKLSETDRKMAFAGVDPRLYRVFKVTNLQSLFEFFEDRAAAVAGLAE